MLLVFKVEIAIHFMDMQYTYTHCTCKQKKGMWSQYYPEHDTSASVSWDFKALLTTNTVLLSLLWQ